jgi:hypothetical protein
LLRSDIFAVASLLAIALYGGCLGQAPEEVITPREEVETPEFVILSPEAGEHLHGDSVTVSLQPINLEVLPAGGPVKLNEGHFHITLDETGYEVVYSTSHTYTELSPGEHTIQVELVNNDHTPKSPRVVKTVTFTVEEEH